jgi:hypothetical protein
MEVPRVLGRISDEECLGARIKTADRQLLSDAIPMSSAARHKEMAHRIAAVEQSPALVLRWQPDVELGIDATAGSGIAVLQKPENARPSGQQGL